MFAVFCGTFGKAASEALGSRLFPAKPLGVLRLAAAFPIPVVLTGVRQRAQGVCPSIGADRVMGAVGSEPRRRARSRCHSTSSVRNKGDGLLLS